MSNSCSDECSDNNDDSLPENGNGNTNERMAFQVFDFTQLKQGENESVQEFYNRVVKVKHQILDPLKPSIFNIVPPLTTYIKRIHGWWLCGSVGRAVAYDSRGLRSNPIISKIYLKLNICFLSTVYLKYENKEKEAGNGPFF